MATKIAIEGVRTVDFSERLNNLSNSLDTVKEAVEFEFYEEKFITMNKISAHVIAILDVFSEGEAATPAQQTLALLEGISLMLRKEDRQRFSDHTKDIGASMEELYTIFGAIIEELSNSPLDSDSSAPTTSNAIESPFAEDF